MFYQCNLLEKWLIGGNEENNFKSIYITKEGFDHDGTEDKFKNFYGEEEDKLSNLSFSFSISPLEKNSDNNNMINMHFEECNSFIYNLNLNKYNINIM